jgi:hypothetical protein
MLTGGISLRLIFKNGHDVPQPIIMAMSKNHPDFVRFFSIFKNYSKKNQRLKRWSFKIVVPN